MIAPEISILLLAVAIDQILGEPPAIIHPVVWMGKVIAVLEKLSPSLDSTNIKGRVSPSFDLTLNEGRVSPTRARGQLVYGALMVVVVVVIFGLATFYVLELLRMWNIAAYIIVGAFILKTNFAVRELRRAAVRVFDALAAGQLDDARRYLRHLVSRDTHTLDEPLIVAATVESVAENVSDSFISPLLFFLILGVPGAVVYRTVNTMDSMIGYHGKYEYLGKAAARLDDILNIIPSRLAGALTVVASALTKSDMVQAWRIMLRDHGLTESPNAGWTMSAMSGALGVQLEKIGHYRLGDPVLELAPLKIMRAVNIMYVVAALGLSISLLVEVLIHAYLP